MDIEKQIIETIEDTGLYETGVVERLQDKVTRLTGIVAALTQALVDNKILTEDQLKYL